METSDRTPAWRFAKHDDTESSSWHSQGTTRSAQTPSTAGTDYSQRYYDSRRFPSDTIPEHITYGDDDEQSQNRTPRSHSTSSVGSSTTSSEDAADFEHQRKDTAYPILPPVSPTFSTGIIASSPHTFAEHFPSDERMLIRHDSTTSDGNMNLRIDTLVPTKYGMRRPMTLFHLRMHDLKSRDFSLRRYCRDSGREVCRTERQYHEAPDNRQNPNLYRSLSYAFASLKRQGSYKSNVIPSSTLEESTDTSTVDEDNEEDDDDDDEENTKAKTRKRVRRISTNTINLEFSNYAHVDITRKGRGVKKCYMFEYWGIKYSWRRQIRQDGELPCASYHLFKDNEKIPSAHIVPDVLSRYEMAQEREKGGWIPQCSMWIRDHQVVSSRPDVADVIVATGLIALVDDTIKRTWPLQRNRPFAIPLLRSSSSSASTTTTSRPYTTPSSYTSPSKNRPTPAPTPTPTRNLMGAVFRPQTMHARHNTQPHAHVGFAAASTPYGHYRRRTTS